ncbi:hypothetical protein ABZ357_30075 [Streptomyces sp. NPDC005917]|uniref:hypothetical protein n=1 Tax=unclassified Streptomyces TaxID=2593676 RepID=UPI0033F9184A
MTAREELPRLVPPPAEVAVEIDWERVEGELGTSLPDDYKRLAEHTGQGLSTSS